jgi:hypothetical protein
MDGTRHPSPSDRIVRVGRAFEWSRLESELMTLAYERVVPAGRFAQGKRLLTGHEQGGSAFVGFDGDRPGYATGA